MLAVFRTIAPSGRVSIALLRSSSRAPPFYSPASRSILVVVVLALPLRRPARIMYGSQVAVTTRWPTPILSNPVRERKQRPGHLFPGRRFISSIARRQIYRTRFRIESPRLIRRTDSFMRRAGKLGRQIEDALCDADREKATAARGHSKNYHPPLISLPISNQFQVRRPCATGRSRSLPDRIARRTDSRMATCAFVASGPAPDNKQSHHRGREREESGPREMSLFPIAFHSPGSRLSKLDLLSSRAYTNKRAR